MELDTIRSGIFAMLNNWHTSFKSTSMLFNIISKVTAITAALFIIAGVTFAQVYDNAIRPNVDWFELETPHFRILYHEGYEAVARRAGRLLESEYVEIQQLVGGSLKRFPVIINGYNDLSNGYVTTFNFRMEVEAPPLNGKIMNPQTGGHLENLMAHELVHALQFSEHGGFGISRFLYIFSPDLGRSLHGFMAPGFMEGYAVYQESQLRAGQSGRGNFAPFSQRFNSNFGSNNRWNLGQMVTPSDVGTPGDRFYIGGYHFVDWLEDEYGKDAIRKSIRTFAKFPILGYAPHLYLSTGKKSRHLYRDFEAEMDAREAERMEDLRADGFTFPSEITFAGKKGPDIYRLTWISETEILYYGRFYNDYSGFWIYDVETHKHRRIIKTRIDENYAYSLNPERTKLMYSRYSPHIFQTDRYISKLYEADLSTGKTRLLTNSERLLAPEYSYNDHIYALKNDRETNRLVKIAPDGKQTTVVSLYPDNIVQIATNQSQPMLSAIIANKNGVQGLWFTHDGFENDILQQNPDISFENGAIFDPVWSKDGLRLTFSADRNGVMNVYTYNYVENEVFQLTNATYSAMEASFSPDESQLALILYSGNYRRLATISTNNLNPIRLDDNLWNGNSLEIITTRMGDELQEASEEWESKPFISGLSWLKPRMVLPNGSEMPGKIAPSFGLELSSADLLRKNAYTIGFEYGIDRLFYDVRYRYSGIFPSIEFGTSYRPYSIGNLPPGTKGRLFGEERSWSISTPMTFHLDHQSSSNVLIVVPEFAQTSYRLNFESFDDATASNSVGPFSADKARLFVAHGFRLRQTRHSPQPTAGLLSFVQIDHDIRTDNQVNPFSGARFGMSAYLSPMLSSNHSLRLGFEVIRQDRFGFNTLGILHEAFTNTDHVLSDKNFGTVSTRYTFPLYIPDRGGFALPFYAETIYLAAFSQSIYTPTTAEFVSIAGLGIRARFRIFFGIPFDVGVGYARNVFDSGGEETIVFNF